VPKQLDSFNRFDRTPTCNRQTDGQTDICVLCSSLLVTAMRSSPDARRACKKPVPQEQQMRLLSYVRRSNTNGSVDSVTVHGWWRGTVVERRSLAGELSLSCA